MNVKEDIHDAHLEVTQTETFFVLHTALTVLMVLTALTQQSLNLASVVLEGPTAMHRHNAKSRRAATCQSAPPGLSLPPH